VRRKIIKSYPFFAASQKDIFLMLFYNFYIIEHTNEWDLCPHGWGFELGCEHHNRPLAINECKYVHTEPKQEDKKNKKNKKKEQGDQQRKRTFLWGVHHISDAEELYGLE
jgi:hypothetical protein